MYAVKENYPNDLSKDVSSHLEYRWGTSDIEGLKYSLKVDSEEQIRSISQNEIPTEIDSLAEPNAPMDIVSRYLESGKKFSLERSVDGSGTDGRSRIATFAFVNRKMIETYKASGRKQERCG